MRTTTRLHALLFPVVAVAATMMLSGCLQIGPSDTGSDDNDTDTSSSADTDTDTDVDDEGETVDVFDIAVGDCINDPSTDTEVTETTIVDCDAPHDFEIYDSSTVADGDFPGDDEVSLQAETDCVDLFTDFVGIAYDESVYSINYFVPTEGSWEGGDREILCLIGEDGTKTTGSLSGAAQ